MRDEKLIQKLKEDVMHTYFESWDIPRTLERNLKTAIERMETLLDENERFKAQLPKWVSVDERLPEMHTEQIHDTDGAVYSFAVSDRVLVKPRNRETAIGQCEVYEVLGESRTLWENDGGRTFEVTHWMPLPSTEGVERMSDREKPNPNCRYGRLDCTPCINCDAYIPTMTNADRIRAMTDEELADIFSGMCRNNKSCDDCPVDGNCPGGTYDLVPWIKWLQQPCEDSPTVEKG